MLDALDQLEAASLAIAAGMRQRYRCCRHAADTNKPLVKTGLNYSAEPIRRPGVVHHCRGRNEQIGWNHLQDAWTAKRRQSQSAQCMWQ